MDIFYPFDLFAKWFTFDFLSLEVETRLGLAVEFFVYDVLKILLLLAIVTHIMGAVNFFLPVEKIRNFLTSRKFYGLDYFLASLFGAITPFCSCSSIPLFIGFLKAKTPLGVTFAFLITSPLVNEIAVAMFLAIFGWQLTLVYVVSSMLVGMVGGFVLEKLKLEKYIEPFILQMATTGSAEGGWVKTKTWQDFQKTLPNISKESFVLIRQIGVYVLIGVGVGAGIHGFVPANFFEEYLAVAGFWSVPLATILAVPLYANASGVVPVVQSLVAKGVEVGTALSFMMAVVGLSFPEAMILKKVLKWQLLVIYFGVVTLGIILVGYTVNVFF